MSLSKHIYRVDWQDAYVTISNRPKFKKKCLTVSVGFIVLENKEFLIMSHFYNGIEKTFDAPFTIIPIGMVKKKEKLSG